MFVVSLIIRNFIATVLQDTKKEYYCNIVAIINLKAMRNTQARTEILKMISDSKTALSHYEIEKRLGGLCNRVTTYRVLERLEEEGHIHKFVNIDGRLNFAACHDCDDHHHHDHAHFSCVECGSVTCLEKVEPIYKIPPQYQVQEFNFTLSGVCPNCK